MDVLRVSSGLERNHHPQQDGKAAGSQTTLTPLFRIFRTIPPERVGLNGEYDHSGLAKRVILALNQSFQLHEIAHLRVSQRGTVVILTDKVSHQRLLNRMVHVALGVDGAADVEVNGVSVIKPLRVYANSSDCLNQTSYAC
jgi:hypothetical protein